MITRYKIAIPGDGVSVRIPANGHRLLVLQAPDVSAADRPTLMFNTLGGYGLPAYAYGRLESLREFNGLFVRGTAASAGEVLEVLVINDPCANIVTRKRRAVDEPVIVGPAYDPPLNSFSVSVAFSVRRLRDDYAGYCMRVRNSASGVLTDIGFQSDGLIDTRALVNAMGADDLSVNLWYNQGSAAHIPYATIATNTTLIGRAGAIITRGANGIPFLHVPGDSWGTFPQLDTSPSENVAFFGVTDIADTVGGVWMSTDSYAQGAAYGFFCVFRSNANLMIGMGQRDTDNTSQFAPASSEIQTFRMYYTGPNDTFPSSCDGDLVIDGLERAQTLQGGNGIHVMYNSDGGFIFSYRGVPSYNGYIAEMGVDRSAPEQLRPAASAGVKYDETIAYFGTA